MGNTLKTDNLEENSIDVFHDMAKGVFGTIPVIGPLVAELYGSIIPNQRLDRLADFLHKLSSKFEEMELDVEDIKNKLQSDSISSDMFDEVCMQASKSKSQERKEYLVNLLINGLNEKDTEKTKSMLLLDILRQLTDAEILILYSHTWKAKEDKSFRDLHSEIVDGPYVHMGSSNEELEDEAIYEAYKNRLYSLNLLKQESNGSYGYKYEITMLGKMLLRFVGFLGEHED